MAGEITSNDVQRILKALEIIDKKLDRVIVALEGGEPPLGAEGARTMRRAPGEKAKRPGVYGRESR